MRSFDPLVSDAPLIVYIDYKSPYAFIATEPTFELEDQLGIEADWRPLTLDIPSYLGSARLDERGNVVEQNRTEEQWAGVKYAYRDARRYAALRGLTLRGTVKIWDTSIAHIGMMWAKRQGRDVLRAYTRGIYVPFWRRELDAEDPQVIASVLARAGADLDGFESFLGGEGRREHDAMQRAIFDAGIFGVPSYVVGGELFFGRENLPMVRWLLSGKIGPPPDIAYRRFEAAAAAPSATAGVAPGASAATLAGSAAGDHVRGGSLHGARSSSQARSHAQTPIEAATAPAIVVAIDFGQPQSYLALAPTRELAASCGIEIDWRPFAAPWSEPPAPESPDHDRTRRHLRFRARYVERDLHRYAAAQGIELRNLHRPRDSSIAGMGLLFVKRAGAADGAADRGAVDAYVARVFDGYWSGELDLEDVEAIREVMRSVGVDGAAFDPASVRDEYDRCIADLRASRVITAPTYVVGEELFIGRAHLPMIRWLIEGKEGPPPI